MLEFQQNEQTAERRRWILVLVDSTDGVTGKTGQTGTVKISKNGGEPEDSTASIFEVDAVEMPGHYYIQLTAAELDTLGFVSIYYKAANTLAFHDRALVSYNDPYVMAAGGFGGSAEAGPLKLTKKTLDLIALAVWEYQLNNVPTGLILERAAIPTEVDLSSIQDKFDAIEFPPTDLSPVLDRIDAIEFPPTDLSPVLARFDQLEIPQPFNYDPAFAEIKTRLDAIEPANTQELRKAVADFTKHVDSAVGEISTSLEKLDQVEVIKDKLVELKELVDTLTNTVDSDMVSIIKAAMVDILSEITHAKYDIIEEIEELKKTEESEELNE